MESAPQDVTSLLHGLNRGDSAAEGKLIPVIYDELRRLAAHDTLQERPEDTLQATALVHKAFSRVTRQKDDR